MEILWNNKGFCNCLLQPDEFTVGPVTAFVGFGAAAIFALDALTGYSSSFIPDIPIEDALLSSQVSREIESIARELSPDKLKTLSDSELDRALRLIQSIEQQGVLKGPQRQAIKEIGDDIYTELLRRARELFLKVHCMHRGDCPDEPVKSGKP